MQHATRDRVGIDVDDVATTIAGDVESHGCGAVDVDGDVLKIREKHERGGRTDQHHGVDPAVHQLVDHIPDRVDPVRVVAVAP